MHSICSRYRRCNRLAPGRLPLALVACPGRTDGHARRVPRADIAGRCLDFELFVLGTSLVLHRCLPLLARQQRSTRRNARIGNRRADCPIADFQMLRARWTKEKSPFRMKIIAAADNSWEAPRPLATLPSAIRQRFPSFSQDKRALCERQVGSESRMRRAYTGASADLYFR